MHLMSESKRMLKFKVLKFVIRGDGKRFLIHGETKLKKRTNILTKHGMKRKIVLR